MNRKQGKFVFKYEIKPFPHFDSRIGVNSNVWKNLSTPSYIASHSFYPFIHYTITSLKYKKGETLPKPKKREIFYASHMDGYIFKYYGELLNDKYNKVCSVKGIDHVSLAYRNNKNGKCNIDFAAEVVKFITEQKQAFIFVSDFSKYFDSLDHKLLKERLALVLGNKNELPNDWWNIFKHLTKFSWVEKDLLLKDLESTKGKQLSGRHNKVERYYTPSEFRQFRKRVCICKNKKKIGIPQGTAISAVLANIYAFELDEMLNNYVFQYGGIYRRYSDDIIVVIPIKDMDKEQNLKHISYIEEAVKSNKVTMGESKTTDLYFLNNKIYKDSECSIESKLDYLGFSFNGYQVKIREKSLFKYYHRAYKKVASVNWISKKENKPVGRKKLYSLYTHLGWNYKGYGNFVSYAKKAHSVFGSIPFIESLIYKQIKRHWNKIQSRLVNYP
ncbi:reverse transcriptase domain-containing protein [Paenibacillus polymyxa]|uniref:reverse transcriptase domain-containing protein n=1 Tax=Paenibacillus polymyxa TaxID=1406 RepID=UPI00287F45E9|nr:reverse transcriptase domain-containing protein [Paenibacillus polymyxa]